MQLFRGFATIQPMVITYYGASCFKVQSGELVLAFNPPAKESEFKSPRFGADIVFVSKNDKDYNGWESLVKKEGGQEEKTLVIDGNGEYETRGIYIKGVGSGGGKTNTIYTLGLEDINICHLGAFGEKDIDPSIKEKVGEVDILFAPVGDGLLDPQKAASIVAHIEPKIVIPMHYKEADLKKFLKEFGGGAAEPAEKLTVKRKDLAEKKAEVVILKPAV